MVADAVAAMARPGASPATRSCCRGRVDGRAERAAPALGRPAPAAGRASRTAPSSPCRSPTASSSAPAPSSSSPGTARGSRATPWPARCPGARPPGPTPTPSATWPGRPRTARSTAYVVDDIAATLRPFCDELAVPDEPSLVAFRSVAHLGTRIEGRLAGRRRRPRAPRAAPSHPGRGRHAAGRGAGPHRRAARPATAGYWAGPVGGSTPTATGSG